jgi:hypothetical protein
MQVRSINFGDILSDNKVTISKDAIKIQTIKSGITMYWPNK